MPNNKPTEREEEETVNNQPTAGQLDEEGEEERQSRVRNPDVDSDEAEEIELDPDIDEMAEDAEREAAEDAGFDRGAKGQPR